MTTMKKVAACLALAGLLMALYGVTANADRDETDLRSVAVAASSSLDPINGLAPIEDVIELFRARADERPTDYLSRTQLGQALSAQARETADLEGYERAEVVLVEALAINPHWQPAQLALAGALHSQHRFAEALEIARSIQESDPGSLPAIALAGDAHLELGDLAAARTLYEELATAERSAPVVSRLARLASLNGDHEQGVQLAREALEMSTALALRPNAQAFYHYQLGRLQFEHGRTADAIRSYEQALSIDASNAAATESLAFAYAAVGDLDRALVLYESLVEGGTAPDLHGSYSDVLRAVGRLDEAAEQDALGMTIALETMERFPAERRHLVGFLVSREPAVAVELARSDFEDRRDRAAYDTLAWALFNNGEAAEAAAVLASAPEGDAPFASMLYHEAAVLAATGDEVEALRLVSAALELNPTFHPSEAIEAQRLFERLST